MAKYIPVGDPSNESERLGIRLLRDQLPDHYVVIGNLDLAMPRRRNTFEYDAIVVCEWGLHAVEIKGWTGLIRGDQRTWDLEWGRVRNPFPLNEQKAKALRDLVVHQVALPEEFFCRSVVFLPLEGVDYAVKDTNFDRVLRADGLYDFFVDPEMVYALGPGPMLDAEVRQQVVDAIVPLAEPSPGLPRVEAYDIEGELQRDGVPYREFVGRHRLLQNRRKVRIKRYHIDPLLSDRQRRQELNFVLRDMEALERLEDNPYIARSYETLFDKEDGQLLYLVSEWVGPKSLRDSMGERVEVPDAGTKGYRRQARLALHLLLATEYMHARGIVHRNLHPGAVWLTGEDGAVPLKITDFDQARIANQKSISGDVSQIGTEGYAAPDLWEREHHDHSVDLFSVGAILYELFAGRPLVDAVDQMLDLGANWQRKRAEVADERLRGLLGRLTARDPTERVDVMPAVTRYIEALVER